MNDVISQVEKYNDIAKSENRDYSNTKFVAIYIPQASWEVHLQDKVS